VFGVVSRDVDADFLEDFDGLRVNIASRLGSSASYFDEIACSGTEDAFGKMAAAGVAGAENEDEWFHGKSEKWKVKR